MYAGAVDLKLCTVLRGNEPKSSAAGVLPRPPALDRSTREPLAPAENREDEELALKEELLKSPGVDPLASEGLELVPDELPAAFPFTGRSYRETQTASTEWSKQGSLVAGFINKHRALGLG